MRSPFVGAMTALVTPFRDNVIDDAALVQLVEQQIAGGIDGLVPMGTTGENPTVSHDEHVHVVAQVVKAARGRVPVIAGAGSNNTAHAIELARAAREVGADGLLVVTPYYNKPSQDGLLRHFSAIASAVPLPMIVYNVPSRTSCDLLPETVARLAELPSIVGIKEATGSMQRATQLLARVGSDFAVLSGDDFSTMPLLAIGGHGVISVISNLAPRWMADMCDAAAAGDWARARKRHHQIQALCELCFVEPSPAPIKAMMVAAGKARTGVELTDQVRAPVYAASEELRARIAPLVAAADLS
jgi:4-hydroxy-tetrahydrodipicolinate synthase